VGVARQYCGVLGKQDNCQVAVSITLANAQASVPVAYRLYLPKEWARDPVRRHKAGVPSEVQCATKTEIALAQLQALLAEGAPRHCVLTDAGYGVDTACRSRLSDLGLPYVVGITSSVVVWPPGVEPLPPKRYGGRGRPPVMPRRTPCGQPMSVKALARALPASAMQTINWRQGTNATLSGRFAAVRVRHAGGNAARARLHPEPWLLIEWPAGDAGPLKYFRSNLPADTALNDLVAQAHLRWRIKRDDQGLKQELGLRHYEGRGWRGLHHHAALTIAAYGFLVSERLAAGRTNGAKKTFIARQAPALPADDLPRASPARAAARGRFHGDDPPPAQRSTHPSPRPLPARRPAKRKTTFVTQEDWSSTLRPPACAG
jgi:SRSO17 transposase